MKSAAPPGVLMVGTGEYTTGYVAGKAAESDKKAGVVALVLFDLRRRGLLNPSRMLMAGTRGAKFPEIRKHLQTQIADRYTGMDVTFKSFPADDHVDADAYQSALGHLETGDLVVIFTPDDTHYAIAAAAIERGCHVLLTKPAVKTLEDHRKLVEAADRRGVLVMVELHKRYDPIYRDARDRIRTFGDFSYFNAYMSQPKHQLETFRAWAGKSSDISYYLNSHHVDFHAWAVEHCARPVSVTACASTGVAGGFEDTIALLTQWQNQDTKSLGTAVYTASWIAPPSDVHSQQRFHYMGHTGEVQVDQAHRGYTAATDSRGFGSCNPLFMKYEPGDGGEFAGQQGYGYASIENFVTCATAINQGHSSPASFTGRFPTLDSLSSFYTTAVLEAGRASLDHGGAAVRIVYSENGRPLRVEPQ